MSRLHRRLFYRLVGDAIAGLVWGLARVLSNTTLPCLCCARPAYWALHYSTTHQFHLAKVIPSTQAADRLPCGEGNGERGVATLRRWSAIGRIAVSEMMALQDRAFCGFEMVNQVKRDWPVHSDTSSGEGPAGS